MVCQPYTPLRAVMLNARYKGDPSVSISQLLTAYAVNGYGKQSALKWISYYEDMGILVKDGTDYEVRTDAWM